MGKLRVGLLFGGRSEEHEISIMSARSVYAMADKEKYEIIPYAISKKGYWLDSRESREILLNEELFRVPEANDKITTSLIPFLKTELDLVFPILHGPYGEDGRLQGMLEMFDIPYVGAGVVSSAAGMDKEIMKNLFSFHNIPQGKYRVIYTHQLSKGYDSLIDDINENIGWPCFVKPANLGSSIGISKVNNSGKLKEALEEALKYDYKAIIEEYIKGREVECSVLGNEEIMASLPGEIKPKHEFYDYEAKYKDESTELIIPANLKDEIVDRIKELAIQAFKAIDGRGFARVDFFIREKDEEVLVNEINTIPGFTRYSMYPKLWEVSGLKYSKLIDRLIELALEWQSK
jgi:D-alanine-D-alanine ligase